MDIQMNDKFEQYRVGGDTNSEEDKFEKYRYSATNPNNADKVNTFLGQLPKNLPEFKRNTPENKALVEDLINVSGGTPGMKVLGSGLSKAGSTALRTGKEAFTNLNPYKEALQKATEEHADVAQTELGKQNLLDKAKAELQNATEQAEPVKPGLIRSPTRELENVENEIGTHINAEGAHDVRAAPAITNRVKSIEDYWSNAYKDFENTVKDSQFHMPEKAMDNIGYDMEGIMAKLKAGANPKTVIKDMEKEAVANQNPYYKQLISKAPTAKDTNAADFLAKRRDFRDALGGLKQDLKSERYGSMEKEKISEAIQKAKEVEEQINETLNQGLGEFKPEFDRINKGYAEQVFPLRKNPIVKAARKGKLSDNIIKDLRTNEPGMPVLRQVVKQDPELLRNVVGQRYMAKPSEIHNPNELMREYLDEMPEFKNLLNKKENIMQKTAKQKNISLEQKMNIEKELADIKKSKLEANKKMLESKRKLSEMKGIKNKAKWNLIKAGMGGSAIASIPYGYGKFAGLLTND